MKKLYLLLPIIFFMVSAQAQQYHAFSLNQENRFVQNPAIVGTSGYFNINAAFRKQWFKIDDSPYSVYAGAEFAIQDKNIGLGSFIIQDATGPLSQTAWNVSFAYHLNLGQGYRTKTQNIGLDKSILSFGISASMVQYRLDGTELELDDETDDLFLNRRGTQIAPDIAFGVYYTSKFVYAGISVPQLLGWNLNVRENGREASIKKAQHIYALVGGRIPISNDQTWILEPSVWFRYTPKGPPQGEINVRAMKEDIAWLGVGYRTRSFMSFQGGFWINKKFSLGYSYDLPLGSIRPDLGQTHELFLGYRFQSSF